MTDFMTIAVAIYFSCAILLVLYGLNCHLLIQLFKRRYPGRLEEDRRLLEAFYRQGQGAAGRVVHEPRLPRVTTQLPIYNEMNVAERLIDAVAAMNYPAGRHEIQVLDDSTDETRRIVARKVAQLKGRGVDIHHITRRHREGFKAGALKNGLALSRGEFLAIFDADFVPPRDFLLKAMPFFHFKPDLGFVQARWGHLNAGDSLVTRFQAIGIDGHFMVEQWARNTNRLFMNFNGTAGIFRKAAVTAAGNWQGDTLTEDMDLSYRIQLAGWQCRYLIDLVAPAEIPSDLNAFKSQQFRWAKGSTQTAIKLMPRVLRSRADAFAKFQAFMHMSHYVIHPLMLTLAVLAPVLLLHPTAFFPGAFFFLFGALLLLSCTGPSRMYLVAEKAVGIGTWRTLLLMPAMICFGCGLAVNNTRAVLEAVLGIPSAFVRTPKSGTRRRKHYRIGHRGTIGLELALGLWCLAGMALYFHSRHYLVGHFLLMYALGFLFIGGLSWIHRRRAGRA
ncbi:MAG: glycosyltransferase [Desulfobacterales bacterium]|nr:glycosyltransferase [Desulfobacterales bacterium]MDJ0856313.1 glycosyltransferase [Desulfobacterales bacterium]MDJ0989404.1 glycosyltransferase [Desulfobacterales bacterium]